ncbi:unnamed protein product [Calypogeia fissa]
MEKESIEEEEGMDKELWEKLPEELLPIILAKLPVRSLAQFRSVCKSWSSLWYSESFVQLRSSTPPERSWFIFNNYNNDYCLIDGSFSYDISCNKWHKFVPNLPSQIERVAASAGGLLFCVSRPSIMVPVPGSVPGYHWPEMFVCNPLKESWIRLVQRPGYWQPIIVGMVADPVARTYKVILADRCQGTEIYDSRTKSWKLIGKRPTTAFLRTNNSISVKEKLVTTGALSLLVFDSKEERWSSIGYPVGSIFHPQISNCHGRLHLVGFLPDENRLEVWDRQELDGNGHWNRLYSSVLGRFSPVYMGTAECAEFLARSEPDDLLCYAKLFSARTVFDSELSDHCLYEKFVGRVLFYSISQNSWCLVDKRHVDVKSIGESFRFDPTVGASV